MAERKFNSELKPHLTKDQRIPKCYKEVEKVLQSVKSCQGSIKTIMYNSRLRGGVFNKVYALSINVLKYRHLLDKIIEETELLQKEPTLRKELAGIMIYELLFGKGLPGESKPVVAIKKYEDDIEKVYRNSLLNDSVNVLDVSTIPKYVRVNTLVTSVSDVLNDLEHWNFQEIKFESNATFDEYLDLVKSLKPGYFLVDYHFKDLLVFASDENLSSWTLYQERHVFIQDKSSYIPVHALDPEPGSKVLDACAAPGMKTAHIAALMKDQGKIYAFEKHEKRFKVLEEMMKSASIKICSSKCNDFYTVNCFDPKFESVEYILVDPTCSGSGMVNRMDEVTDMKDSKNDLRIKNLAGFQILLLKHALGFPNVKRVVYSTCSITEEENEFVVHEVLNHFRYHFKLVPVMPDWPIRGSDKFEFGHLCVRAYPKKSLTNGFFVAMFERMNSEQEEQYKVSNFAEEFLSSPKITEEKSEQRRSKSKSQEIMEQDCENLNIASENIFSNFHKTKADKSDKRKVKSELSEEEEQQYDFANKNSLFDPHISNTMKSKKRSRPESQVEDAQQFEISTLSHKNSLFDSHDSKSEKRKRKSELRRNDEQQFECSNFITESSFPVKLTKSKKKRRKTELQEILEENFILQQQYDVPEGFKSTDGNVDSSSDTKCSFSERNICEQNPKMSEVKKKKHKRKHNTKDQDLPEVTEFHSKPCTLSSVHANREEHKIKKKKRKKKLHSESIESVVNVYENETSESVIESNVNKDSITAITCDSPSEIVHEELQKKKHKKKCKDKKYKED